MIYGKKIYLGILVFVLLIVTPFLANIGKANAAPAQLNSPEITAFATKQSVETADFMKAYHMQLFNQWREEDVRQGNGVYVNDAGQKLQISLEQQFPNQQQFCDTCHNYVGVNVYCWDCHQKGATQ